MPKNRKLHAKQQRLAGMRQKKIEAAKAEHARNLQTLQQVMNHTDRLRAENPELFVAVMDSVQALAKEANITVGKLMEDGVEVYSDDGHVQRKTPQQIIDDIRQLHHTLVRPAQRLPAIQQAMRMAPRGGKSNASAVNLSMEKFKNTQAAGTQATNISVNEAFNRRGAVVLDDPAVNRLGDTNEFRGMRVDDAPSIERQHEAASNIAKGLAKLDQRDMATMTAAELQDAMACGYERASSEWLRRYPDASKLS